MTKNYINLPTQLHKICYKLMTTNPLLLYHFIKKCNNPGFAKRICGQLLPYDFAFEFDTFGTIQKTQTNYVLGFADFKADHYYYELDSDIENQNHQNEVRIRMSSYFQLVEFKKYLETLVLNANGGIHLHIGLPIPLSSDITQRSNDFSWFEEPFKKEYDNFHDLAGLDHLNLYVRRGVSQSKGSTVVALRYGHGTLEFRCIPTTNDYETLIKFVILASTYMKKCMCEIKNFNDKRLKSDYRRYGNYQKQRIDYSHFVVRSEAPISFTNRIKRDLQKV